MCLGDQKAQVQLARVFVRAARPLIVQNPYRMPFRVIILARFERPDEGQKTQAAKCQRHGNKEDKNIHETRPTLTAFKSTVMEESDIASAAASGVAYPKTAIGTAMRLYKREMAKFCRDSATARCAI